MPVLSIDDMPYLKEQLGKARTDRARYARRANSRKEPYATNLSNTVIKPMQNQAATDCNPINDLVHGIANLDHQPSSQRQGMPLSVNRLYGVLQCIEIINTREVMAMMDIEKRQAQRYVRAIKLLLPQLERILL